MVLGQLELNKLYHSDCFDLMSLIPDKYIDCIIGDLPYSLTECFWESDIPLDKFWVEVERIIKDNGVIVLTGVQPFTSDLVVSNKKLFKYSAVWEKTKVTDFAQCNGKFLNKHEDILVFSKGGCSSNAKNKIKYYPQGLILYEQSIKRTDGGDTSDHRPGRTERTVNYTSRFTNYPTTILKFASEGNTFHATQKPVKLFEYLIKSFTLKGDIVFDPTMGSGTTAIAAMNTKRRWLGSEKDETIYVKAKLRIKKHFFHS